MFEEDLTLLISSTPPPSLSAPFLLNESLSKVELGVTFLISCGATIVVLNASHSAASETLEELTERFKTTQFIAYITIIFSLCVGLAYLFRRAERNSNNGGRFSRSEYRTSDS